MRVGNLDGEIWEGFTRAEWRGVWGGVRGDDNGLWESLGQNLRLVSKVIENSGEWSW